MEEKFSDGLVTLPKEKVVIEAIDLHGDIETHILEILKERLEGRCVELGYIVPNTLIITSRSQGKIRPDFFMGDVLYDVKLKGRVYRPVKGSIIRCIISKEADFGLLCSATDDSGNEWLHAVVPMGMESVVSEIDLTTLKEGDEVMVEVIGSTYNYKAKKIGVVGRAVYSKSAIVPVVEGEFDDEPEEDLDDDLDEPIVMDEDDEIEEEVDEEAKSESGDDSSASSDSGDSGDESDDVSAGSFDDDNDDEL